MQTIGTPLNTPALNIEPKLSGGIELSKDMQQTLSLLSAFSQNERIVLGATRQGALFVTSKPLKDVIIVTANTNDYDYQGDNIECSEAIIIAHPDNVGRCYVKPFVVATSLIGLPLDKGDSINIGVIKLNNIFINIATDTDKVIILYA